MDTTCRNGLLSDRLRGSLKKTLPGDRQLVFITGEPAIGKTALVDAFQREASCPGVWSWPVPHPAPVTFPPKEHRAFTAQLLHSRNVDNCYEARVCSSPNARSLSGKR